MSSALARARNEYKQMHSGQRPSNLDRCWDEPARIVELGVRHGGPSIRITSQKVQPLATELQVLQPSFLSGPCCLLEMSTDVPTLQALSRFMV